MGARREKAHMYTSISAAWMQGLQKQVEPSGQVKRWSAQERSRSAVGFGMCPAGHKRAARGVKLAVHSSSPCALALMRPSSFMAACTLR